ncbi:MAG: sn-glycerol-3-phosphate ABC transporter ATP-binding protein UgpC [Oscillospiraceae bacterium]|jgi:multiple sugar transport system ATP-binding protein|nr:sn-glycerol-3-phosphate ABC transporter ATP-binding protein UgpC [Oscillospiraceae bacterium]
MAGLTLKNVKKIYDNQVLAVADFSIDIADKEFIVLVGPSGCGKSTALRMIAGLEEITDGELYIDGELMNNVEPKDRDISMVFQNYALFPHMTVYDNIAFGLKRRKVPKNEIDQKVQEVAEILQISELLQRKPKALSGGQRQRVAIGRAIVRNPKVYLMDEPLSNLDAKLRNQMRAELKKLHKRMNTTFIYVTHDQTEAMTLGDRIVVMKRGYIQQIGTPHEVFDHPRNLFVAGFIGTPQMNFIDVELVLENGKPWAKVMGAEIPLELPMDIALAPGERRKAVLGIRPEYVETGVSGGIAARIAMQELLGSTVQVHLELGDTELIAVVPVADAEKLPAVGMLNVSLPPDKIQLFDPESKLNYEIIYGSGEDPLAHLREPVDPDEL